MCSPSYSTSLTSERVLYRLFINDSTNSRCSHRREIGLSCLEAQALAGLILGMDSARLAVTRIPMRYRKVRY